MELEYTGVFIFCVATFVFCIEFAKISQFVIQNYNLVPSSVAYHLKSLVNYYFYVEIFLIFLWGMVGKV